MARPQHTPPLAWKRRSPCSSASSTTSTRASNPRARSYEALKRLSDSEVLAVALLQQLRGTESERSCLRDVWRSFAHLFPGVVGLSPSSFHRRVRRLRRFFEPLRRAVLPELVGAAWARWGSFSVYGFELHLICPANRVPLS